MWHGSISVRCTRQEAGSKKKAFWALSQSVGNIIFLDMSSLQEKADQEFLEEYSVSSERAQEIRNRVQKLKEAGWVDSLRMLAQELGEETPKEEAGETLALPGLGADSSKEECRTYACPPGHPAEGLQVRSLGATLRVQKSGTSLLEITFLPKDEEFLVCHMSDDRFEELNQHLTMDLALEIKAAKAKKSERQAVWKARFSK
jgi:hypothetical protein